MKTKLSLLMVFSVLLAGNTWAQLNCTNCFQPDGITPLTNPIIAASGGTYSGDIKLSTSATAVFTITGNGRYYISGSISGGNTAAGAISMQIQAPSAGALFMTGGTANTYAGATILTAGFLMLGKTANVTSIPGTLIVSGTVSTSVYCMNDNQLGGTASILELRKGGSGNVWKRFNLNGTTQRVAAIIGVGPSSGSNIGIIQNYEFSSATVGLYPYNAGVVGGTGIPTLEIVGDGTNTTYTYGPDCLLRAITTGATGIIPATKLVVTKSGMGTQEIDSFNQFGVVNPLEFNCTGGILRYKNPGSTAPKISFFNSTGNGTIDFYAAVQSTTYTIPSNINFQGDGKITKSGPGIIKTTITAYTTTGIFRVLEGTFQNVGGTFTGNTATLTVDSPTTTPDNFIPTFDLFGYNAAFGGLTGGGTIKNDNGNGAATSTTGYYDLTIGQGSSATFTFDGVIKNNSTNAPVAMAANAGGINLNKVGTGTQFLNGVNMYSGPTTVSGGKLGGSGSIASSAVTVGPGASLFGGSGTGNNGVFTTGNLTFTGTSTTPSHVTVYANNTATPAANALSLIQVGGTAGSRTGTGTITAGSGVVVVIDFMDPITADGVYTVISSADASALTGTFNAGINTGGRCLAILKNSLGIQVVVGPPAIAASTAAGTPDLAMLCAGNTYTNAIAITNGVSNGTWRVFKADGITDDNTGTTAVNTTVAGGSITTGSANLNPTAPTSVMVQYTRLNCLSNLLLLKINVVPAIAASTVAGTPDLEMLCSGSTYTNAIAITNGVTNGTWKVFKADGTTDDDTGTSISGATAAGGTLTTGSANLSPAAPTSIKVQYSRQGCLSNLLLLKISIVLPSIAASTAAGTPDLEMLCAGSTYTDAIAITNGVSNGTWKVFKADGATDDNTGTTVSGTTATGTITAGSANLSPAVPTSVKVQYSRLGCLSNLLLLKINVLPSLAASAQTPGTPLTLCDSGPAGSITIASGSAVGAAGSSWTVYDGTGTVAETTSVFSFSHTNQTTATVTPNVNSGTNSRFVEYTNAVGCVSNKLRVDLNAKPVISIMQGGTTTSKTTFCSTELTDVALSATDGSGKYSDTNNVQGWLLSNTGAATLTANSTPNFTGAVLTYVAAGSTTITVRDSRNCLSDGKALTINTTPALAASAQGPGTPLALCDSGPAGSITIASGSAVGAAGSSWTVYDGTGTVAETTPVFSFSHTNQTTATVTPNVNSGTNSRFVEYTNAVGCVSNKLRVDLNAKPVISIMQGGTATSKTTFCSTELTDVALAATGGSGKYSDTNNVQGWLSSNTGVATLTANSTPNFTGAVLTYVAAGSTTITVKDSRNCLSDGKALTINTTPALAASAQGPGTPLALCDSGPAGSITIASGSAVGAAGSSWTVYDGTGTVAETTPVFSFSHTNQTTATVTPNVNSGTNSRFVEYTNAVGCVSNKLRVDLNAKPVISIMQGGTATSKTTFCSTELTDVALSATDGSGKYSDTNNVQGWLSSNTGVATLTANSTPNFTGAVLTYVAAGSTTITVKDSRNCLSDGKALTINTTPALAASAQGPGTPLALCDSGPAGSITIASGSAVGAAGSSWTVYDGTGTVAETTPVFSFSHTNQTTATVTPNVNSGTNSRFVEYTNAVGCVSNKLRVDLNAKPVISIMQGGTATSKTTFCSTELTDVALAATGGSGKYSDTNNVQGWLSSNTGVATLTANSTPNFTGAVLTYVAAGSTTITVRDSRNCLSDGKALTINTTPSLAASTAAGSPDLAMLCPATNYSNAIAITNGSANGTWAVFKADGTTGDDTGTTVSGTATQGSITTGNANLSPTASTSVKVRYTNQGCSSNLLSLTINALPSLAASAAAGSPDLAMLCPAMTYANAIAITNGSANGTWAVFKADGTTGDDTGTTVSGTTTGSLTTGNANLSPTAPTSVKVRYTNQGCSSNLLLLTINVPPSLAASTAAGSPDLAMLCPAMTYANAIAVTNGSANGTWAVFKADGTTGDDTGTSVSGTATGAITTGSANLSPTASTSVKVRYTNQGCSSNLLSLTINAPPSLAASAAAGSPDLAMLCPGMTYANAIAITNGSANGTWAVFKADGTTGDDTGTTVSGTATGAITTGSANLSPTAPTSVKVRYTNQGCSSNLLLLTINVPPSLAASTAAGSPDLAMLCPAMTYTNAIAITNGSANGTWAVFKTDGTTGDDTGTTVSGTATQGSIMTGSANLSPTAPTSVKVRYTNQGCSSNLLLLTMNVAPSLAASTAAGSPDLAMLCPAMTYTNAIAITNGSANGTWAVFKADGTTGDDTGTSVSGTATQGSITTGSANLSPTAATSVKVRYTNQGCSSNLLPLTINAPPSLAASTAAGSPDLAMLCPAMTYANAIAVTNGSANGTWAVFKADGTTGDDTGTTVSGTATGAVTTGNTNLSPTAATSVKVRYTNQGCSSNLLPLTINAPPSLAASAAAGSPDLAMLCPAMTYPNAIAITNGSANGTWAVFKADGTTGDDTGTTVSGTATGTITTGNANLSPTAATSVKVRYTNQGCSSNLLLLTMNVAPSLAASTAAGSPDLAMLCPATNYPNAIAITNGSTNGTWKVFKADGTTDDNTGTTVSGTATQGSLMTGSANLSPTTSTSVKIRYTNQGCSSNLLLLTMNLPPSLAASTTAGSPDLAMLCPGKTYPNAIAITNGSANGTWAVFKADGTTDDDTGTSISGTTTAGSFMTGSANLSPTAPTSVKVRYTNQGCSSNLLLLTINVPPSLAASTAAGSPDLTMLCPAMTYPNAIAITNGTSNSTWKVFKADGTTDDDTGTSVSGTATAGSLMTGSANLSPTATSVKVRYTSQGCSSNLLLLTIKAPPSIAASTAAGSPDLELLCAGSTYPNAIAITNGTSNGTWKVFRADGTTDDNTGTTVSGATAGSLMIGSANLTPTAATSVQVQYTSQGCLSNLLLLTINVLPSFIVIDDLSLCPGQEQSAISPAKTTGTDRAAPTGYKWQGGAVGGLPDNTGSFRTQLGDWTQTDGHFTASTSLGTYAVDVSATNAITTCISTQRFNLVVGSNLTIAAEFASPICSGTHTNITMTSPAANITYTWSVSTNTVGATGQGTPQSSPRIEQALTNTGTTDVSVTYTITGISGSCTANTTAEVAVSKDIQNTVITTTGGGHVCIDPALARYTTNLQPTAQGATSWTYYSELSPTNPSGISIAGYSHEATKSASSVIHVTDNLTMSGGSYGVVDYYFRMYNGICLGPESPTVSVTLHAAPTLTIGQAAIRVCSGQTTALELGSTTGPYLGAPVKYTWNVTASATTPTVSGYTTVAEGGQSVGGNPAATPPIAPATQPAQAVAGGSQPQTLSIPASATTQGEIAYQVKPWLSGCPGNEGTITVAVPPLPVANLPTGSPFVYCAGTTNITIAFTATNGGDQYFWTGGAATGLNDQPGFGGQPSAFTASATGADPLVATVSLKAKNSLTLCESTVPTTFTITVNPTPSITTINGSASNPAVLPAICAGPEDINAGSANITIASSATGTQYTWNASRTDGTGEVSIMAGDQYQPIGISTPGPGTPEDSPLQSRFIATANATGSVTLHITPRKGQCVGTAKDVTIGIRGTGDSFTTVVTNAKPVICNGEKTDITVGAVGDPSIYRYSWTYTDQSGNVSGGNASTDDVAGGAKIEDTLFYTATPKKAGQVIYYVTVDNGACSGGTLTVNVEIDPIPTITPVAASAICSGTSSGIVLSTDVDAAESAGKVTYTWTIDNPDAVENASASTAAQAAFTDPALINRSATTIDATVTYHFAAKYAACVGATADVVRTVSAPIATNTIGTTASKACFGDQIILTANAMSGTAGGEPSYQWWAGSTKIERATAKTYTVPTTTSSKADYQVMVTNRCQTDAASGLASVEVTSDAYFDGASAAALASTAVVNKEWVKFAYTPGAGSDAAKTVFSWDFGDTTPTSNIQHPSHLYTTTGIPSYTTTLWVSKSGQPDCKKLFTLAPIVVTGTPVTDTYTGDGQGAALSVFPIPARDQITVTSSGQLQRIVVSDLRGRPLMKVEANGCEALVSVSTLSSGVYLLTVESSTGTRCLKIIKE